MTLTVTVADVHQMTPDVKQFRLVADDHTFECEPGQHTQIHFERDGAERSEGPSDGERGGTTREQDGEEHLLDALQRVDLDEAAVYVCGVPEMVVETRELFVDAGVDEDRVYTEGWEEDAAGE